MFVYILITVLLCKNIYLGNDLFSVADILFHMNRINSVELLLHKIPNDPLLSEIIIILIDKLCIINTTHYKMKLLYGTR